MSCNKFGLEEIRFINSGNFPNESVRIDDFTLLLGSSGVGKTTVMSAICYFYTMDKEKTRPTSKELSFYDWHLEGSYAHLIYVYTNSIGKNLIILSKDKGKVKHTFINIQNYTQEISTLYLDGDMRSITLKEIIENCVKNSLAYYRCETVTTFRKMMCKRSYGMLPNKDKPTLDFSFYDSEESANIFGKYLFNIYSNSSVRDRGIKDMLISLMGEKEYSLNISDFKYKLEDALTNVSHFELIKNRREKILELDESIIEYKMLCEEIESTSVSIETILFNSQKIQKVIEEKQLSFVEKYTDQFEQNNHKKEEWQNKSLVYTTNIAQLQNTIQNNTEIYTNFTQKYRIEFLIEEQEQETHYENEYNTNTIKIQALSSGIEELELQETLSKQKERVVLNEKKENEKEVLETTKDRLNTALLTLSQEKENEKKQSVVSLNKDIETKTDAYTALDKKISKEEIAIELLPNQTLENDTTKKYQSEIENFKIRKNTILADVERINDEKENLEQQREINFTLYSTKIEKEVEQYTKKKEGIQAAIDGVCIKLEQGKNNLFSFLQKSEMPHKRKILALLNEEILFEEKNLHFSIEESSDSLYGLKIEGDIESLANRYEKTTLEEEKASLEKQLNELVTKHNTTFKNLEENLKSSSKKIQREIQEKSREAHEQTPKIKNIDIKIARETRYLEEEVQRLQEELDTNILDKKRSLKEYTIKLKTLSEYLHTCKKNKESCITQIESKYQEKEIGLHAQLNNCKQSINGINTKYKDFILQSDERINATYNEIKKSENIDTNELESLQKIQKHLERTLKKIKDNKALVLRYKDEILPNYKSIEKLQEQLNTINIQSNNDKTLFEQSQKSNDEVLDTIKKSIGIWKKYSESFKNFVDMVFEIEVDTNKKYENYSTDEIVFLLENKKDVSALERYKTLNSQRGEKEKKIILETNKVIDDIPAENMMKLKTKADINVFDENIEQYIAIARSYADFIKTKFDIEGTSLQLHRLIEIINDAVSKISHIKGTFQSIVKDVNKINRTISDGIKNISVIDFIRLNFEDTGKDEIVSKIENIGDMLSANMLIGYENSERSQEVKKELITIAQELQMVLHKTFQKNITVSDISTLSFDVSENQQIIKGITTLDSVGSNGTSIMIKAIIYITLLRMVSNRFANSENIQYHCIIDEIGQISADYFTELMEYAKHLEFVFINGTAANDDDIIEAYPRIYMGTRQSANEVSLTLIDTKDAMDNW